MGRNSFKKGFIGQKEKKDCREFITGYFYIIYSIFNTVFPTKKLPSSPHFMAAQN
jgi:hypothetical protein